MADARLSDVAEILVSNVDKKSVNGENEVRLCNYMDVYRNDEIRSDMELMQATASASQLKKFQLRPSDVIITKDSERPDDIAIPAYVETSAEDIVCGYHLAIIRPKSELKGRFLKFWFEHPATRHYFSTRANGATRFGLTVGAIEEAQIGFPGVAEQERIAECILLTEQERVKLRHLLRCLQTEKRALMQQLLTGKRRVKL